MSYQVRILPDLCSGTTNCVEEAPNAFEMDEDRGLALVRSPQAADGDLLRGAEACPMQAIHLYDPSGRRVFP